MWKRWNFFYSIDFDPKNDEGYRDSLTKIYTFSEPGWTILLTKNFSRKLIKSILITSEKISNFMVMYDIWNESMNKTYCFPKNISLEVIVAIPHKEQFLT